MQGNLGNEKVFMRSMASRGAMGGISKSLRNAIRILDVAGYNIVLIESVGAGQLEVEISKVVDLTVVLFTPHTGDNVQAVKAGLTEIGDIYVVNKADLEGATTSTKQYWTSLAIQIENLQFLRHLSKTGTGVVELSKNIDKLLKGKKH